MWRCLRCVATAVTRFIHLTSPVSQIEQECDAIDEELSRGFTLAQITKWFWGRFGSRMNLNNRTVDLDEMIGSDKVSLEMKTDGEPSGAWSGAEKHFNLLRDQDVHDMDDPVDFVWCLIFVNPEETFEDEPERMAEALAAIRLQIWKMERVGLVCRAYTSCKCDCCLVYRPTYQLANAGVNRGQLNYSTASSRAALRFGLLSGDKDEIFVEVGGCQALLEVKANQMIMNVKTRPWVEFVEDPSECDADGSKITTQVQHPSGYDRVGTTVQSCVLISCVLDSLSCRTHRVIGAGMAPTLMISYFAVGTR